MSYLQIKDHRVAFHGRGGGWEVGLESIRLIGEYTNRVGSLQDDWFFAMVTESGEMYVAPMYSQGLDTVVGELNLRLRASLQFALAASTDDASRICWPRDWEGCPLLAFVPDDHPSRVVRGLQEILGLKRFRTELSPEAQSALAGVPGPDSSRGSKPAEVPAQ